MRIGWDERKNRINQRKHKVAFEVAALVFDDPDALSIQDRQVDGEPRWQTLGSVAGELILLVAHIARDDLDEVIRIISARRATPQERKTYEKGSW